MSWRLILFDIDGTLIATNYAGRKVMRHALNQVYGSHGLLDSISFSGRTDLGIITSAMTASGLQEAEVLSGLPQVYDVMARKGEQTFVRGKLFPCPGVLPLLDRLRAAPQVILGLQTGNIRSTARQKLSAAGLDPAWFIVGAFGADSTTRDQLIPAAWRQAFELTGKLFSGHNTIAVGDTPGDILAARANGAIALAVASGFCSLSELAECRPDYLMSDLSDTETVLTILTTSEPL